MLGEFLVGFRIVDAGREVRDVREGFEVVAALTERLAFGGSTSGERRGKPGKYHGLAFVIRQAMDLAVGPLEREVGRHVADLQDRLRRRWRLCRRRALLRCCGERGEATGDRPPGQCGHHGWNANTARALEPINARDS
jgi:hypothetical protein